MNHEDLYHRWIQERSQVEVDPDFASRVMSRIKFEPRCGNRLTGLWSRLIERITVSSWAQLAAVGIAFLVGLGRVLLSLHLLLTV